VDRGDWGRGWRFLDHDKREGGVGERTVDILQFSQLLIQSSDHVIASLE
jgi:hypothetical protein